MSTCILVLGTPRSGTSCVAGILHHLGVPMGKHLLPPDDLNPGGYFQDREFDALITKHLSDNWPVWDTAKRDPDDPTATKITELAAARSEEYPLWGVKSNRMIFFLEAFLKGAGRDVRIINTQRPQAAAIASWRARVDPIDETGTVIKRIAVGIPAALAACDVAPSLVVDFDSMIDSPAATVERIAAVAGLDATTSAVSWINKEWRRFTDG